METTNEYDDELYNCLDEVSASKRLVTQEQYETLLKYGGVEDDDARISVLAQWLVKHKIRGISVKRRNPALREDLLKLLRYRDDCPLKVGDRYALRLFITDILLPETPLRRPSTIQTITIDPEVRLVLEGKPPSKTKLDDENSSLKRCMELNLCESPLSIQAKTNGEEMRKLFEKRSMSLISSLTEENYSFEMFLFPKHIYSDGAGTEAETVFSNVVTKSDTKRGKLVSVNPCGKPELGINTKLDVSKMPVGLECKSFPEEGIEELLQCCTAQCQSSYFGHAGHHQSFRFYDTPPKGLGMLTVGPAIVMTFVFEMVGYQLFSLFDGPCAIGSTQHKDLMQTAENMEALHNFIELESTTELNECPTISFHARWTKYPLEGKFYKILTYGRYRKEMELFGVQYTVGQMWRRLYKVYDRYSKLDIDKHDILVKARLWFGEFQVAVEMDFCDGAVPMGNDQELSDDEQTKMKNALVFLAQAGLVYTDFHAGNLMKESGENGALRLVDYDDMIPVENITEAKDVYEVVKSEFCSNDTDFGDSIDSVLDDVIVTLKGIVRNSTNTHG